MPTHVCNNMWNVANETRRSRFELDEIKIAFVNISLVLAWESSPPSTSTAFKLRAQRKTEMRIDFVITRWISTQVIVYCPDFKLTLNLSKKDEERIKIEVMQIRRASRQQGSQTRKAKSLFICCFVLSCNDSVNPKREKRNDVDLKILSLNSGSIYSQRNDLIKEKPTHKFSRNEQKLFFVLRWILFSWKSPSVGWKTCNSTAC